MTKRQLTILVSIFLMLAQMACEEDNGRAATGNGNSDADSDTDSDTDTDSDSDTDTDTDADSDTDLDWKSCGSADVNFELATPTVMLLIDRSGTMNESLDGTPRWDAVKTILVDPSNGVVKKLEGDVIFGIQMYTSLDGFSGGTCPMLDGIDPAPNNYEAVSGLFDTSTPEANGDTPTGEALHAAAQMLADAPSPKSIVLATDGAPDTCTEPDPWEEEKEQAAKTGVETEAIAAYEAGIAVHVISVGDAASIGTDHLKRLANVGQGYDATDAETRFYDGKDASSLEAAFDTIMAGVRECVLSLEGAAQESMVGDCVVKVNDIERTYNDPDGWVLKNESAIELEGQSCEDIKTGEVNVSVRCPCGTIVID